MKRFFTVIGIVAVLYVVCGKESADTDTAQPAPAEYHITLPAWSSVKSCFSEIYESLSALTADFRIETVPASESGQSAGTSYTITIAE